MLERKREIEREKTVYNKCEWIKKSKLGPFCWSKIDPFCQFKLKKSATESHRMLVEAYSNRALSKLACEYWFRRFQSGNIDISNKDRGKPAKKFEEAELQTLLDAVDGQSQVQMVWLRHQFPLVCKSWERSRRQPDLHRTSWTIDRWRNERRWSDSAQAGHNAKIK